MQATGIPRRDSRRPADQALFQRSLPYCASARDAIRREYSWAGAATPAQRSTTQPQESPRKDSDLLNATALLGISATAAASLRPSPRTRPIAAWLADIARRIGTRLFLACDEEANWRGWQTTVLSGGLARRYRDVRFILAEQATNLNEP